MAYAPVGPWVNDGVPPISAANLDHIETQYDEAEIDLDTHKIANIAHRWAVGKILEGQGAGAPPVEIDKPGALDVDNDDHAHTGDLIETDLVSYAMPANTLGTTSGLRITVLADSAGAGGAKTFRLYFGAQLIGTAANNAATNTPLTIEVVLFNRTAAAQRARVLAKGFAATTAVLSYVTGAIDTTAIVTIKVTGQLGNVGDTITSRIFAVEKIES